MSNFLAIATVTEALRQLLDAAVRTDINGAVATAVRPSATGQSGGLPQVGVNAYLYQVSPNAALRNGDLPTRREDGSLAQRPREALDLQYLLTFYGNENQFEPQRVLGSAVRVLHARPVLTRKMIQSVTNAVTILRQSDLADEVERVKFTPLALSLEELSKLWSVFFQTAYTLSVAYQASVVLIEGNELPEQALPVRDRRVHVVPFERPKIESVTPQVIQAGGTLTLKGHNLKGNVTQVRFGVQEPVVPSLVSPEQVVVSPLPGLFAGVNTVQVIHLVNFGTPDRPDLRRGFESNVAAFILAPKITIPLPDQPPTQVSRGSTFSMSLDPPVRRTQRVALLLGDQAISPVPSSPTDPLITATVGFPIPPDFPLSTVLVRVQVDGAESPLVVDTDPNSLTYHQYVGPRVEIVA